MEDKLSIIRKAMMNTIYKDMSFTSDLQKQVYNKINKGSYSKRKITLYRKMIPILCGVMSIFIIFILSKSFFIEHKNVHELSNDKIIDNNYLTIDYTIPNSKIIYKPISFKTAKKVVLLPFDIPKYIPFKSKDPSVVVTQWNNKSNISLELTFTPLQPTKENPEYITLNVSNFPNIVPSVLKQKSYQEKVKLANKSTAFIEINPNVSMISWKDGELEYFLNYFSFNNGGIGKQQKIELIKIANSMRQ